MALTSKEIIELRAPELAIDPSIDDLILEAENETGQVFGDLRPKAVALLVLHWLALKVRSASGVTTGTVQSEREGDLSISYSNSSNSNIRDSYLAQTLWGIELYNLKQSTIIPFQNRIFNA